MEQDGVRKGEGDGAEEVAAWWRDQFSADRGVLDEGEDLLSSWFPIESLPEYIYQHILFTPPMGSKFQEKEPEVPYQLLKTGIASFAPKEDFADLLVKNRFVADTFRFKTQDLLDGKLSRDFIDAKEARNVIIHLLSEGWNKMATGRGLLSYKMANSVMSHYFVGGQVKNDRINFTGADGQLTYKYIMGYKRVRSRGENQRFRHWLYAVSAKPFLYPAKCFSIGGHVLFSDDALNIWYSAERIHKARMNQCKRWWNVEPEHHGLLQSRARPWKINQVREGVCYVGLVFKQNELDPRNSCCAAQMFLDSGDGVVFKGTVGPWHTPGKEGEYHLGRQAAKDLMGMLKVFLCHSSGDKPAVRDLYKRLRSAADYISPWLDEEDLLPGQRWEDEIPRAVRDSDVVIVCLSRSSVNKTGYVQKEIKYALDVADEQPDGAIFLIPARLEECELPERLKHLHWVDLHEARGFDKLMRALKSRAEKLGLHLGNHAGANAVSVQGPLSLPDRYSAGGVIGGGALTVDATSLLSGRDGVWEESAEESRSVKSFLDALWSRLSRHVPAHTYGETWVLRNSETKQVYWALTFDLEAYHGLSREALTLKEAGITPGMTLEVVPLSGSKAKSAAGLDVRTVIPERVDIPSLKPVASSAPPPELDLQIRNTLKDFRDYLIGVGFSIEPGEIGYEVVPGDVIRTEKGDYCSSYDWVERIIHVAEKYAGNMDSFFHEFMRYVLIPDLDNAPDPFTYPEWWPYYSISSGLAVYFPCSFKGSSIFAKASDGLEYDLFTRGRLNREPEDEDSADSIGVKGWGSAFWELRNRVGNAEAVDKLAATAWTSWHPNNADNIWGSFVRRLLKVEQRRGGQYMADISAVLKRRKLRF